MNSLRQEIRDSFQQGDALTRLILINLAVFVGYLLLRIVSFLFKLPIAETFIEWTALPNHLGTLVTRPWTLISYMFLHQDFLHILFNLIWLFFAGKLFMEYFGGKRLISTYVLGGLIGGILFVIAYNVFPIFQGIDTNNRGASAGVMAVVFAVATYAPQYPVRLFFVLNVKLWMVAGFILLLDLLYLGDGNNAGGHIAHLGGAAFGFLSIKQYQKGRDWTAGFSQFLENIQSWFKPKEKPKVRKVYSNVGKTRNDDQYKARKVESQEKMDEILDKISQSGYESLTKDEKDFLFKIGQD